MATLSIFTSDDVRRVCTRISHEIIERNNGSQNIVLVGLLTRGALVANRLAKIISEIENSDVQVYSLDITTSRDDLSVDIEDAAIANFDETKFPKLLTNDTGVDFSDSNIVIVDDVLFTGRSVRAAMDVISKVSRPSKVELAVLVDRGHRELPIRADFVGKNLPTKRSERVNVLLQEIDGQDGVDVEGLKIP
ncbi:MAG: bifunctional pyr operon transcriptional regulator/uracil phosphoribosyltransferase PyrR [Acidimicrobiia bacterium]